MRAPCFLLLFFLALSFARGATAGAGYGRPNFILLMADDMGWGDTHYNGNAAILTPNLDSMAAAGVNFRRFHSQAAVCSPTRGSILTGRHPDRYGVTTANAGRLEPGELTLAEVLKTQGYRTGHFGKWHLGVMTTRIKDANRGGPGADSIYSPPWLNGFDRAFSTESKVPTWDPMKTPGQPDAPYGTRYWNERGEVVTDNLAGDDSRVIMDRVIPFIREAAAASTPFLAVVWFHTAHLPVVAGEPYLSLYKDVQASPEKKAYMAAVTAMDDQIGRLRRELQALKLENTMVAFTSDNGPETTGGNPGETGGLRGRKHSYYEGGIRVPGLVEWPAVIKRAVYTDYLAVSTDYYPTILDILDLEIVSGQPMPVDGVSILEALLDQTQIRPRPIGFGLKDSWEALISGYWKLVRADEKDPWQLYNLLADEKEANDLAGKPGRKELVDSLAKIHAAWEGGLKKETDYPKDPLTFKIPVSIQRKPGAMRRPLPTPAFGRSFDARGRKFP